MAKIFLNIKLKENEMYKSKIWSAKNGATRRELVVIINDKDFPNGISGKDLNKGFIGRLGWLDKGNHSFIFINKDKNNSDKNSYGIFLNSEYSFKVTPEENVIYSNSSVGGYGNSESKFAIIKPNTVIEEFTYKYRRPSNYTYFDKNEGFINLGSESKIFSNISDKYNSKVIEILDWCKIDTEDNFNGINFCD